jgi:pimeloyl-ACP methyl ester carboxylesterase
VTVVRWLSCHTGGVGSTVAYLLCPLGGRRWRTTVPPMARGGWGTALVVTAAVLASALAACGDEPLAEPPPGSRTVEVSGPGGGRLAAVEAGPEGATGGVVLVHGASTRKELWFPLLERLADEGLRALAYDAAGVGGSSGDAGVDWAPDVRAVVGHLRATGVSEVVLVGSSRGAATVLEVATDDEVAGVVTFSGPGPEGHQLDEPGLFLASEGDGGTAGAARALAEAFDGAALVVPGDAHGADLLDDRPGELDAVVRFVVAAAGGDGTAG